MKARWVILLLAGALALGCQQFRWPGQAPAPAPPASAPVDDRGEEIRTLNARIEELLARGDRLARRVNELEFLNEQLDKQLRALGDAPRQRDEYLREVIRQQVLIDRLRVEVQALRQVLGPAGRDIPAVEPLAVSTTAPGTVPGSMPATAPAGAAGAEDP